MFYLSILRVGIIFASVLSLVEAETNDNENLVLADCGVGYDPAHPDWAKSNYMFYYRGSVWNHEGTASWNPDMIVQVPWDGSYPWRKSPTVSAIMPNGDKFVVYVDPSKADPLMTGLATDSSYVWLNCYSFHKKFLYMLPDRSWCSSAYVCSHQVGKSYVL